MSFFDFFRNFLGVRRYDEPRTSGFGDHDSHRESFRNPIWQSDEDDDDDDIDNFWHPESNLYYNIFSNPLEMIYFESQIDNMFKNFWKFNDTFFDNFIDSKAITALPFVPEKDDNLRDRVLKSKPDIFPITPFEEKGDTDLDGRVSTEDFSKMWNKGNVEITKPTIPHRKIGRFIRKETIRRPDGTIEKKQVIKDSEGNEETIISKEANNKTHVVTIRKDKNGVETRSEDLLNMDESELKDFTEKWKSPVKDNTDGSSSSLNRFPWEKFFGPNPKL